MVGFDEATAVRGGGSGSYRVNIDPEWTVSGNPHGGYLLALLARAAIAEHADGGHPHPLSSSAVYLKPPVLGPATITVETLRQGRTASQVRARLTQPDGAQPDGAQPNSAQPDGTQPGGNGIRVEALFTLGHLGDPDVKAVPHWVDTTPPEVTAYEDCPVSPVDVPGTAIRVAMLERVEQRLDPVALKRPGDFRGWLRFADDRAFDPISLLYAADSFPPATFTIGSVGWVPTLELTVYVRAVPAPGPLRVRQRVRLLAGDFVDQVCEVWDSTGQVVAQATQLAAVRMAR